MSARFKRATRAGMGGCQGRYEGRSSRRLERSSGDQWRVLAVLARGGRSSDRESDRFAGATGTSVSWNRCGRERREARSEHGRSTRSASTRPQSGRREAHVQGRTPLPRPGTRSISPMIGSQSSTPFTSRQRRRSRPRRAPERRPRTVRVRAQGVGSTTGCRRTDARGPAAADQQRSRDAGLLERACPPRK